MRIAWICSLLSLALSLPVCSAVLEPQVAGAFYPSDPEELRSTVDSFLEKASTSPIRGELYGALVPHAGYVYSGQTAAEVYRLLKGRRYETVLILASGHRHPVKGAATVASGSFRTPLGEVAVDSSAAKRLMELNRLIEDLPRAFEEEHSVEVQIPFLQRVLEPGFKLVPLLMNSEDPEVSRQVGEAVAKLVKPGKVLLLVSSDLAHYPDKETARAVDTASLRALLDMPKDPQYFWRANRFLMQRGGKALVCTYCGEAGVLAAQYAMRELGARGQLLSYTNSGELAHGDPQRTVGYAALLWVRGGAVTKPGRLSGEQRKALLRLSREALTAHLAKEENPKAGLWRDPDFNLPAAVFVTLRRKGVPRGVSLRGCIGSVEPNLPLAEAVQYFAIQSGHDHRFKPVGASELPGISFEISRLSPFRKASGHEAVKRGQGVVVRQGEKSGLFLPSVWEDIPDKRLFLEEICEQKAGLPRDCWKDPKTEIQVFDSESFEE